MLKKLHSLHMQNLGFNPKKIAPPSETFSNKRLEPSKQQEIDNEAKAAEKKRFGEFDPPKEDKHK